MSHSARLKWGVSLYLSGKSVRLAAQESGLPRTELYKHLRFANQIRKSHHRPKNDPDEETIRERAEAIKATWSPEEMARRYVGGNGGSTRVDTMFRRLREIVREAA